MNNGIRYQSLEGKLGNFDPDGTRSLGRTYKKFLNEDTLNEGDIRNLAKKVKKVKEDSKTPSPKKSEEELEQARKKRANKELDRLYELAEIAEKAKEKGITVSDSNKNDIASTDWSPIIPIMKEVSTSKESTNNNTPFVYVGDNPETWNKVTTGCEISDTFVRDVMTGKTPLKQVDNPLSDINYKGISNRGTFPGEEDCGPTNITTSATIEGEQKKVEKVNHPSHYNSKGKETIEVLKDYLSEEEYAGFLKGNILKYIHRYEYKAGLEDLEKAKWYLEELIRRNTK